MGIPEQERVSPDPPASIPEPQRSEALEAELAALEAMLPAESPAPAPSPDATTGTSRAQVATSPQPPGAPHPAGG